MAPIRLAIVEDQTLVREGLASLLSLVHDLVIVGKAADGAEALAQLDAWGADVILMDVRMPGMNGVTATRQICARVPCPRVLILTTFDDDAYIFEALRAGAAGYLLKNADPDYLAAAIRAVHAGQAVLDPAVTPRVVRQALRGEAQPAHQIEQLTVRERAVLRLLAQGGTNAEIGQQLALSEGTVKNHVSHILAKLNVPDRAHAIRIALEWNWLHE